MRACLPRISLFLLAACVQLPAFAAQRGRAECAVFPFCLGWQLKFLRTIVASQTALRGIGAFGILAAVHPDGWRAAGGCWKQHGQH